MIDGLDPVSQRLLIALERLQERATRAHAQISSGFRVTRSWDDPDAIDDIVRLHSTVEHSEQTLRNLNRVKAEVDAAESALRNAVQIVQDALTSGTQGATSIETGRTRPVLASRVRALHEQLVNLTQITVEGRYIFSGDADRSPSYQVNTANPNGVDRLLTTTSTRLIEDSSGASFGVAKTAQEIFDSRTSTDGIASNNVFAAVNGLRTALENDDSAGIDLFLGRLREAADHLNQELAWYGLTQNRIASAIDTASKAIVQDKSQLSQVRDADLPAAILDLEQAQIHQDAALQAQARFPRPNLFDYLK